MRGLGDAIKKVTTAVGVKPCERCIRTAGFLNKVFPFPVKLARRFEYDPAKFKPVTRQTLERK